MNALLVVDLQESAFSKYDASLLTKINDRILAAREQKQEIIYIKNTKRLRRGWVTDDFARGLLVTTDNVFCKMQADSFSSDELLAFLTSKNISEIEIIGIDGNSCVSASAKGALKRGYAVSINPACIGAANPLRFEKTKEALSAMGVILKPNAKPEFRKITEFPRGTLYDILQDAYSFDSRNQAIWEQNWHETDDFFYDNPKLADQYGFLTCLDGLPIGFVTWDPRHRPDYVEIGHNGIREPHKRKGYGRKQLEEAIRRIKEYEGLARIIVWTNSNLAAPRNYERVGFTLCDRKKNDTESAHTGDFLCYEILL